MQLNTEHGNRTKEFQDFFTPENISNDLYKEYSKFLKPKPYINNILEPSVGSGNLIWPILESDFYADITCIDIQKVYIDHLKETSENRGHNTYKKNGLLHITNVPIDYINKQNVDISLNEW